MMSQHTSSSLFAGCGGASTGCRQAGFEERLAIDKYKTAAEVFRANHPTVPMIHRNIKLVSAQECLEIAGLATGELDLLQASPPCQGYSMAGKRNFGDPRNTLYREVMRIAAAFQAKVILIENVPALMKIQDMRIWASLIIKDMESIGYNVKAAVLDAQWLGVPQRRERAIFLGVRCDLGVMPSFPQPLPIQIGCRRLDGLCPWKQHHNKIKTVMEGQVAPTLTCHTQFLWSQEEEFGLESYKFACGFPPEYQFPCGHRQMVEMLGNAVPPTMMMHIARHIRTQVLGNTLEMLSSLVA